EIIQLTGNLTYTLTLDPSSWLFDDRKIDLDTYFSTPESKEPHRKIKKKELLKHDYSLGIPLQPFLKNAELKPEAKTLIIETGSKKHHIDLEEAQKAILAFSNKGKFLQGD